MADGRIVSFPLSLLVINVSRTKDFLSCARFIDYPLATALMLARYIVTEIVLNTIKKHSLLAAHEQVYLNLCLGFLGII